MIAAAKFLAPESLGVFAVAYACYSVMIGIEQAAFGDPTVLTLTPGDSGRERSQLLSGSALLGGVTSAATLTIGLGWGRGLSGFMMLALLLPGLSVQDSARFYFIAVGRPSRALAMDLVWTLTSATAIAVLVSAGRADSWPNLMAAWALPGGLTGMALLVVWRIAPRWSLARLWLKSRYRYWSRFMVEFASTTGSWQATFAVTVAFVSVTAAGQLRAATALFGVIHVLFNGVRIGVTPELVRRTAQARPIVTACVLIGLALGVVAGLFGVALDVLPRHLLHALLGANTAGIAALVIPLTLQKVADGISMGPFSGLRAYHRTDTTMRSRAYIGIFTFVVGSLGAGFFDVKGAAYGIALGSLVGLFVWWPQFVIFARHQTEPVFSLVAPNSVDA